MQIQRMNHELASIKQELVAYEAARDSAVSMAAKHHVAQQEYQHERAFWQQRCAAAHKRMSVAAAQSQQCNNERRDVVRGFANYASDRQQVATSAHQRAVAAVAMHSQQADGEARSLSTQVRYCWRIPFVWFLFCFSVHRGNQARPACSNRSRLASGTLLSCNAPRKRPLQWQRPQKRRNGYKMAKRY